jgi:hypothetical protein
MEYIKNPHVIAAIAGLAVYFVASQKSEITNLPKAHEWFSSMQSDKKGGLDILPLNFALLAFLAVFYGMSWMK